MSVNARAAGIVVAIGTVGHLVLSIGASAISLAVLFSLGDVSAAASQDTAILFVPTLVGLAVLCLALLVDAGIGAGYVLVSQTTDPGTGAVGGGIAGGGARLISGLVSACISLTLTPIIMAQLGAAGDLLPEEAALATITSSVGGFFGSVVGICVAFVAGALIAAVAGAITASVLRGQ